MIHLFINGMNRFLLIGRIDLGGLIIRKGDSHTGRYNQIVNICLSLQTGCHGVDNRGII